MSRKTVIFLWILATLGLLGAITKPANAWDAYEVTKKAALHGLYNCLNDGYGNPTFETIADYEGPGSLMIDAKSGWGTDYGRVPLPSGNLFTSYYKEEITCQDLVKGFGSGNVSIKSVYDMWGHPAPEARADQSIRGEWLTKYGAYKTDGGGSGDKERLCVQFVFHHIKEKYDGKGVQSGNIVKVDDSDYYTSLVCIDDYTGEGDNIVVNSAPYVDITGEGIDQNSGIVYDHYPGFTYGVSSMKFSFMVADDAEWSIKVGNRLEALGTDEYGDYYMIKYSDPISAKNKKWKDFVNELGVALNLANNSYFNFGYSSSGQLERDTNCWMPEGEGDSIDYSCIISDGLKYEKPYYPDQEEGTLSSSKYVLKENAEHVAIAWLYTNDASTAGSMINSQARQSLRQKVSLSAEDEYRLYAYYFTDLYKAEVKCDLDEDYIQQQAGVIDGPIKWFQNGATEVTEGCYVVSHDNDRKNGNQYSIGPDTVHALTSGQEKWFKNDLNWGYPELLNYFKTHNLTVLSEPMDTPENTGTTPEDPSESEETEPTCASRAGELGWILCPLIKGAGELLQGFFENWIEPFLQIDAELLSGSDNSVFKAWQGFQTIANLIFVVIFLFVIFSQLTGVGIDNYGIKKVLPKLIIGAVLINLSYIICQLAVDVSNILGSAMKSFFGNIPPDVGGVQIRVNGGEGTGALEAGAVVLTVIVGALVAQKVLTMGIMVIIPILILLLTVLFSLFFLFFMLGIRQALAIVLVAISPLAFVCYILPNTKSLFKKWTDLFKAMLLAYPIASAMVYGGDLVSRILIDANAQAGTPGVVESLGLLVTAAVVSIAPVFAIPGLLKKSLSAIDGVGGMLNKVQSGGRSGAKRVGDGVANSRRLNNVNDRYQNWRKSRQQARDDDRNMRRAGLRRKADGTLELSDRGKAQDRRAKRLGDSASGRAYRKRLADSRNAAFSSYNSDMSAARIMTGAGAMATLAGLTNKQQQQEIQDEILNMAGETGNYDLSQMQTKFAALAAKAPGDLTSEEQLRMKALVSKMSETGFGAKAVASILSGRATGKDGKAIVVDSGTRKMLADYMTSTDVANKVGGKDMYVAQYMRDVAAGNIEATKSFDDWAQAESTSKAGYTNVEFVAKEILNDDEMLAKQSTSSLVRTAQVDQGEYVGQTVQSDGTLKEEVHTITVHAGPAISAERADKMIKSENLHTKGDQDDVLSVVKKKLHVDKTTIDAEAAARAARTPAQ